jgi:hypothetical protein
MSAPRGHRICGSAPSGRGYANGAGIVVLILIACLLVGCARPDSSSEKDRPGGFYGGVSGGHGM